MTTGLIRFVDLHKHYPQGEGRRIVLDGAQGTFDEGTLVAIRGRSGSGKTTLLNLLAGLDSPNHGEIWIDETEIASLDERGRTLFRRDNIGIVFQFFNLIPTLTALENVLLPAELTEGWTPAEPLARSLLERVGLGGREAEYPEHLSGGEQQRVAIARALVKEPRLVLADEPTGNLDRATGDQVLNLLEEVTREMGKTLLIATHSRSIAARADRVLTIHAGRLVPDEKIDLDRGGADLRC